MHKILIIIFLLINFTILAQDSSHVKQDTPGEKHRKAFVDKNGDGYNDNAPDHDKDGIPNGLDPDYRKFMKNKKLSKMIFIDRDGDGINDNKLNFLNSGSAFGKSRPDRIQPQNRGAGSNSPGQKSGKSKSKGGK